MVQQFSMEALHHIMMTNKCQILAMFDEMSVMYSQLDAYKHPGSRLDRCTLLDLYGAGSWSRNFKNKENSTVKMPKTSFNMCGFSFIVKMLIPEDVDAFNDRQFFVCPAEVEYKYEDLKVPMDDTIPMLHEIFHIVKNAHKSKKVYMFEEAAHSLFIEDHDNLSERKLVIIDDEDRRGLLSKAKGQLARIAMVIHTLDQAIARSMDEEQQWSCTVTTSSLDMAKLVMDYIIDQKFALMPPEIKIDSAATSTDSDGIFKLRNSHS